MPFSAFNIDVILAASSKLGSVPFPLFFRRVGENLAFILKGLNSPVKPSGPMIFFLEVDYSISLLVSLLRFYISPLV